MPKTLNRALKNKHSFIIKIPRIAIINQLKFLHSHLLSQYRSLVDIIAYDTSQDKKLRRVTVIYNLLSIAFNDRLLLFSFGSGVQVCVASACHVYAAANWLEREVWDFFGVWFAKHPDLRKLLTDYGFKHHPLRKDFPLIGYREVFYSETENRILHTSVESNQPILRHYGDLGSF
jgi:NADH:ubiquinone oxidoreductase subunit C